jgi:alpha-tubulin suppressor-like RCC1 family protein
MARRKADADDAAHPPRKCTKTAERRVNGISPGQTTRSFFQRRTHDSTGRLCFSSAELGLGSKNAVNVNRPRLNTNLDAEKVGVVDIAAGGMHAVTLTHDNRILTWGVNDNYALGRETIWDGGLRDINDTQHDDDSASVASDKKVCVNPCW